MAENIGELPNWVGYQATPKMKNGEPVSKPNGKPKMDKVPMNPHTGGKAQVNNPATWGTFETAVSAVQKNDWDGVGFVLTKKAGVVGIDLDDCIDENGQVSSYAQKITQRILSYAEKSPSGDGIHILAKGSIPRAFKNGQIELYDDGRFLTYTGNCLPGFEGVGIRPAQDAIDSIIAELEAEREQKKKPHKTANTVKTAVSLDHYELIEKAKNAGNGDKFQALWDGNTTGYESQSEADAALCQMLAFWTGNDETAVDSLFRQSGLYREKWDEVHFSDGATYGQRTVERAIAQNNEVYTGKAETAVSLEEVAAHFSTFADVERVTGEIEWVWEGWLARRYMHILASESGVGKSFLAMRIAACFLVGMDWPDGQSFTGEMGKILWCEAEAAQQLNKERAKKLGLPLEKILMPSFDPLHDIDFRNSQDKDAIWALAHAWEVKFIVVDSLSGADPREENSSDKLTVLKWWAELARNTDKPILITHHLNKPLLGNEKVTLHRLRGSSSIAQMARIVWAIDTPDLNQKDQKRLTVLKNNMAAFPEPIGISIGDQIQFGAAPKEPVNYSELDRAIDFLRGLLQREPLPANDVYEEADAAGISKSTLKRAKDRLGIKAVKLSNHWAWSLPVKLNE